MSLPAPCCRIVLCLLHLPHKEDSRHCDFWRTYSQADQRLALGTSLTCKCQSYCTCWCDSVPAQRPLRQVFVIQLILHLIGWCTFR